MNKQIAVKTREKWVDDIKVIACILVVLGIYVLDSKFERIKLQKTDNPVQDIKIVDGILFTAETTGMGIYRVDDEIIEFISWYDSNSKNKNVSSLGVTPDKAFAVLQASFAGLEVVSMECLLSAMRIKERFG